MTDMFGSWAINYLFTNLKTLPYNNRTVSAVPVCMRASAYCNSMISLRRRAVLRWRVSVESHLHDDDDDDGA